MEAHAQGRCAMTRRIERKVRWLGAAAAVFAAVALPLPWGWAALLLLPPLLYSPAGSKVPILVYHSVHPDPDWMGAPDLVVSPACFAMQMKWLSERFTTHHMDALHALRVAGEARGVAAVQFDDGYVDAVAHAEPVLADFGLKGTVYVATGLVADRPMHPRLPARTDLDPESFLSVAAMRAADSRGVLEFQSHAWSHRPLGAVPPEEWDAEIVDGRERLEGLLGVSVRHFCFPRDSAPPEAVARVRVAGFQTWTAASHDNRAGTDPATLGRLYVTQSGWKTLDAWRFRVEVLLFLGHYWLWPAAVVGQVLTRQAWKRRRATKRVTP